MVNLPQESPSQEREPIQTEFKNICQHINDELTSIKTKVQILEDLQLIHNAGFLDMISSNRAENHDDWMFVGYVLYNIGKGSLDALYMWEKFSKQSNKYIEGECALKVAKMKPGNITIGSLIWLSKNDNPQKFKEWLKTDMRHVMYESLK